MCACGIMLKLRTPTNFKWASASLNNSFFDYDEYDEDVAADKDDDNGVVDKDDERTYSIE